MSLLIILNLIVSLAYAGNNPPGESPDICDQQSGLTLRQAILQEDLAAIDRLFQAGASKTYENSSAIRTAMRKNKKLFETVLDKYKKSKTPILDEDLFYAIQIKNPDYLRALLDAGANANGVHRSFDFGSNSHLDSPLLIEAIRRHDSELVKILLKAGADPHIPAKYHTKDQVEPRQLPIFEAELALRFAKTPVKDQAQILKLLIDSGVDLNQQNISGDTLLHAMVRMLSNRRPAYLDLIQTLLNKGIDRGIKDKSGKTAEDLVKEKAGLDQKLRNEILKLFSKQKID